MVLEHPPVNPSTGINLDSAGNGQGVHSERMEPSDMSSPATQGATKTDLAGTSQGESTALWTLSSWRDSLAAEALLMRGRLAMLDGKLRVC